MELVLCHLYPELLNLYGDNGNILAIKRRCEWRNIKLNVLKYDIGDRLDFSKVDIFFIGGGSDSDLGIAGNDLKSLKSQLEEAIEMEKVILAVCGGYQLLGSVNHGQGLELLNFYTESGDMPMVGNIITQRPDDSYRLVGFENHTGKTFLKDLEPLGYVVSGFGNNGEDKTEGVRYKNVFGTYLHGPLLPKNPGLCDEIIGLAMKDKYDIKTLEELDDSLEIKARDQAFKSIV